MKVIDTGLPYRLAGRPAVAEGDGPVVAEGGRPAVAAEGGRPAGRPLPLLLIGRPIPMLLFQFTGLDGLPSHRIGPSSLHL